MQTVLLVIHVILAVSMIGIILIQRSEGGGLGMGRSDAGMMTARGTANLLTRTTAILAALFFLTSLSLFVLSVQGRSSKPLFDPNTPQPNAPITAPGATPGAIPAPAPAVPAPAPTPVPASPPASAPPGANAPAAPTK